MDESTLRAEATQVKKGHEDYTSVVAATLTLLVYEYLLTFEDERRLVWPSKFSFMKALFFANRYLPFAAILGFFSVATMIDTASSHCKPVFLVFSGVNWVVILIAESILYIRVHAIWGRRRSIGVLLSVTFVALFAALSVFDWRYLLQIKSIPTASAIIPHGCIFEWGDETGEWALFAFFIPIETIAMVALLARSVTSYRTRMMTSLVSDGAIYYGAVITFSAINLVVLRLTPSYLSNMLISMQISIHCIACNRLLLNIRGFYDSLLDSDSVYGFPDEHGSYAMRTIEVHVY